MLFAKVGFGSNGVHQACDGVETARVAGGRAQHHLEQRDGGQIRARSFGRAPCGLGQAAEAVLGLVRQQHEEVPGQAIGAVDQLG